jgi:hypothetical protein
LDGNGRRCSARLPVSRAHSRIGTICSTAFQQNQNGDFGLTSTADGPATTTKRRVACEMADVERIPPWLLAVVPRFSRKPGTTRMHELRVARFHSSSFSETCYRTQKGDDRKSRRLKWCAVICRPDSKGAYENILANCLEVRVVR